MGRVRIEIPSARAETRLRPLRNPAALGGTEANPAGGRRLAAAMGPLIKVHKDGSNAASPGGWLTGVPRISHVSWLPGRDGRYQVLDNPGSHAASAPQLWHAPDIGEPGFAVADFTGGDAQGPSSAASQALAAGGGRAQLIRCPLDDRDRDAGLASSQG